MKQQFYCHRHTFHSFDPFTGCVDIPNWLADSSFLKCTFVGSCSNISCCLDAGVLNRRFYFNIDLEPCQYKMTVSIEGFKRTVSLLDYDWGSTETISLFGLLSLR